MEITTSCELMVFYLGGEVTNFHLHQPGASHEACFMADAQYLLLLQMTSKITDIMNQEDRSMVETASFFVAITYTPWFLKSSLTASASNNDLSSFKDMFELKKEYPKLAEAFLHSMQRHTWYLTEELVHLCLGDDDIEDGQKMAMLRKLMEFEISFLKYQSQQSFLTL